MIEPWGQDGHRFIVQDASGKDSGRVGGPPWSPNPGSPTCPAFRSRIWSSCSSASAGRSADRSAPGLHAGIACPMTGPVSLPLSGAHRPRPIPDGELRTLGAAYARRLRRSQQHRALAARTGDDRPRIQPRLAGRRCPPAHPADLAALCMPASGSRAVRPPSFPLVLGDGAGNS